MNDSSLLKKVNLYLCVMVLLLLSPSCSTPAGEGFSMSTTRIPYKFHHKTKGHPPSKGDVLMLDMTIRRKDSITILPNPVMEGMPTAHVLNGAGLLSYRADPILGKATVGDSLTIKLPASIVYRLQGVPKGIPSSEYLYCDLVVTSIEGFKNYQQTQKERLAELRDQRVSKNDSLIAAYIAQKGLEATKLPSGVYLAVDELGKGEYPRAEDELKFHYRVYLLNDILVDDSYKRNEPFSCIVGRGGIIEGLDTTFPKIPIGSQVTALIPSDLAYGETRMGKAIPPNSNLRFDIKMVKLN